VAKEREEGTEEENEKHTRSVRRRHELMKLLTLVAEATWSAREKGE
jgi:hypothetical protein